jgi:hypothetical protein
MDREELMSELDRGSNRRQPITETPGELKRTTTGDMRYGRCGRRYSVRWATSDKGRRWSWTLILQTSWQLNLVLLRWRETDGKLAAELQLGAMVLTAKGGAGSVQGSTATVNQRRRCAAALRLRLYSEHADAVHGRDR